MGLTVCSACQGIIIPPSHNMISYAFAVGGVSQLVGGTFRVVLVGRLFLGGYVPGILLGLSMLVMSVIIAVVKKYPRGESYTLRQAMEVARDGILAMRTAVIVVGGVILGVFTATQAAAFACIYAFIVAFFVYRAIPLSRFIKILYYRWRVIKAVSLNMPMRICA